MALMQSITLKVLGIGVLALMMLLPLAQVRQLILERSSSRQEAIGKISAGWGGDQQLGGPILIREVRKHQGSGWITDGEVEFSEKVNWKAKLQTEYRKFGIYSAPVYVADLNMSAEFSSEDALNILMDAAEDGDVKTSRELRFPISDQRGLREIEVRINGSPRQILSGRNVAGVSALAVVLTSKDLNGPLKVELQAKLAGTEKLQFLPLAKTTVVDIEAPWSSPSFIGNALPAQRVLDQQGFSAHWQVLDPNRGFTEGWSSLPVEAEANAFGVQLYSPVDIYQQNERAGKYGLLFVAFTFIAFFLFEILKRLRVHPLQYLLVGLALSTFYLVLLALSEQIGFGPAYVVASATEALMIGGYAAAVLATRRAGILLGAILGLVYALLYGLVISDQYSLLIGAIALLVVVGLLMFLTRKVDWYSYARTTA